MMDELKQVLFDQGGKHLIPFKRFTPPYGEWNLDYFETGDYALAVKANLILQKEGFFFTAEPLRMVGKFSFAIEGMIQYEEDSEPEEGDVAIQIADPGPDCEKKIRKLIMDFQIPEDGVVRSWQ